MKLSKTLGAFALTAALAMGTIPAFAAGVSVGTTEDQFVQQTGDADNTASASTKIQGTAINEQLNAVIPIELTVVVPSSGGPLTCPTAAAYQITNKGNAQIAISNAQASSGSFTMVADATSISSGTTNRMSLTVTAGGTEINTFGGMTGGSEIPIAANTAMGLQLAGHAYVNTSKPLAAGALADTMCTVKYTIKPAA